MKNDKVDMYVATFVYAQQQHQQYRRRANQQTKRSNNSLNKQSRYAHSRFDKIRTIYWLG